MVINIIGTGLLLGLVLRYSSQMSALIRVSTSGFSDIYRAVSLQGVSLPTPQTQQ